jgi:hypothetical protein
MSISNNEKNLWAAISIVLVIAVIGWLKPSGSKSPEMFKFQADELIRVRFYAESTICQHYIDETYIVTGDQSIPIGGILTVRKVGEYYSGTELKIDYPRKVKHLGQLGTAWQDCGNSGDPISVHSQANVKPD